MKYQTSITKDEINQLPGLEFHGVIKVPISQDEVHEAIGKLSQEKVLGFDTETRPSFSKGEFYPVSILQLATEDCSYIFRLARLASVEELFKLLSNTNIIKAGVAIHDDVKALQKLHPFSPEGFVDLSKEAEKKGFTSLGLRALTAIFLGKRLSKAAKITNWDRPVLSEAQLSYAAKDAHVGLQIYHKIMEIP